MATRAGLDQKIVVQAAAELADAGGLHELSLATLAERLGVRTPTLYHYVGGQAGLRRELALMGCRELAIRMGKAVMGKAGDEAVLALAYAYRAFVNEHPGLYAATVQAADPDDKEVVAAQTQVVEIALATLSGYHLSHDDAIHVVRMIRSIVHGFATLEDGGGFGIPLDRDETFKRLLNIFLSGLHKSS
ncbi:MAG TPA: TetR/AcrR family transcriptional regulator [Chloroflexia bacterium]|nr:TetR/AcrR family transcriptional regulator [Chloroflexia bacterium]